MPTRPWLVHGERTLHDDDHCRIVAQDVTTPDGRSFTFAMVGSRGFVKVLPITVDGDVVLVRQWRQALGRPTLEVPAGGIEPGEGLAEAAARELAEEAAVAVGELVPLGAFSTSPGRMDEICHCFLATGCTPLPDAIPDEPTEIVHRSVEETYAAIGGEIDSTTCALILLLAAPHLHLPPHDVESRS